MFGFVPGIDQDLLHQFERISRQMERAMGLRGASGIRAGAVDAFPAVNMGASPEQVDIYVFAAGMDPEKLELSIQQNLLSIAGERRTELPEEAQVYRRERFSGAFRRVVSLPEDIDPDQVDAVYRDGVLHITVKRREEARPRRIEVK